MTIERDPAQVERTSRELRRMVQWHLLINGVPACEAPEGSPHNPPCVFISPTQALEAVRLNRESHPHARYQIVPGICPAWTVRLDA